MSPARYQRAPEKNRQWNGRVYDSKKEMRRARDLHVMQSIGVIANLQEQVRIELIPKQTGERATFWIADFTYLEGDVEVWEDCKGHRTEVYNIKRKLVLQRYGKKIRET